MIMRILNKRNPLLRCKFSSPKFMSTLTKILIQAHKLFWAPTNISYILPKYFPHITHLGLSQIFSMLPNLGLYKYLSYYYQKWAAKLCHLYKSPNSFTLWAKPEKPNKTLLQSPLLHGTLTKSVATQHSYKARCSR